MTRTRAARSPEVGVRRPGTASGIGRAGAAGVLMVVCLGWGGCASAPRGSDAVVAPVETAPTATAEPRIEELEEALAEAREELATAVERLGVELRRSIELERRLLQLRREVDSAATQRAELELELKSSIEEVVRSKASAAGGQSRALATSRIAEVRVAAEAVERRDDPEVASRIERAEDLLSRADRELLEENYTGAVFLAEHAGELVRQARMGGEETAALPPAPERLGVLFPAVDTLAVERANLRSGPGLDFERLAVLEVDEPLRALARADEWVQVERGDGSCGWVHSRLLAPFGETQPRRR